jgi:hypothetical protein
MSSSDNLAAVCSRARSALQVATHFAGIVDDIGHLTPIGYSLGATHDGISRPVETAVTGLDERGVSDRKFQARRDLTRAAELIERAAKNLDEAVIAWDPRED